MGAAEEESPSLCLKIELNAQMPSLSKPSFLSLTCMHVAQILKFPLYECYDMNVGFLEN